LLTDDIVEVEDDIDRAKRLSAIEQGEGGKENDELQTALANSLNGEVQPMNDVVVLEDSQPASDLILVSGKPLVRKKGVLKHVRDHVSSKAAP
jgi:hypothetical protein